MAKPKLRKKNVEDAEDVAKRVLAQVRIVDSSDQLRGMQHQMRRHTHVLSKLDRLRVIPDAAVRELLAHLKKRDFNLADQISDIRENLDVACNLLKPPG